MSARRGPQGERGRRAAALAVALLLGAATSAAPPAAEDPITVAARHDAEAAGLRITELAPGHGLPATVGAVVSVHYSGWLYDAASPEGKGRAFDSSLGGRPFRFLLGRGAVIRGWDLGVAGMQPGARRRLVIPAALAYGAGGAGGGRIPPNATLVFDVELLDVQPPP